MVQVMYPQQRPPFLRPLPLIAAMLSLGLCSFTTWAAPRDPVIRAGNASVSQAGVSTLVEQQSDRAVIDWRSFDVDRVELVRFSQPGATSAMLNRVTGGQLSMILGRIEANGQLVLVNPNGIVFGAGSRIDVGSLIASTANVTDKDFMAGRLHFLEPGRPGAGIANHGNLSAADGGLIALVAPHIANSGLIQARLGKVVLGAGDTFTLDLYGDGLINLALAPDQAAALVDDAGKPVQALVSQAGRIDAAGGEVVLINAPTAKAVLDQVINLSGIVQADTVMEKGGRVVLLGHGGTVEATGVIDAKGLQTGQRGGTVEILGDTVHLAAGSRLNVGGDVGGGTIHVGGAYQGAGSGYRAQTTTVDAGATMAADASRNGGGGEVVVWADDRTRYAGAITARGGPDGGDGGRIEVSGKGSLEFGGTADASAPFGAAGSLLLDPATLDIGLAEAHAINATLRTGTSTSLRADIDVNVNAMLDGRGGISGGGLALFAGRDINVNDFIVTNGGAVNLNATTGTVRVAAGKSVFAQGAPITINTGGDLSTGSMVTTGALSFNSSAGSVSLDAAIDGETGPVRVTAARNIKINQPVVNLRRGSSFAANAGGDLTVDAQVDGRGGIGGGAIDLVAGGNVLINDFILTNNAPIRVRATSGSIITASSAGLFGNGGALELVAGADFTSGALVTSGSVNLVSTNGSITLGQGIDELVGALTLTAAMDANLDAEVLNLRSGAPLSVTAQRDINVRAQIDGRGGVAGGSATFTAGRNVGLLESVSTNAGAIRVTAAAGTVTQATGVQLVSGTAPIAVSAAGDLTSGSYATTGAVNLRSTSGAVTIGEPIYSTTGRTHIQSATDVHIDHTIQNVRTGSSLAINAGDDIFVNAQVGQDRSATTETGPVTLIAGTDVHVRDDIVTRNAPLTVRGTAGTVILAPGKQLRSGSGTLTVSAGTALNIGTLNGEEPNSDTPLVTTGTLDIASAGDLSINAPIPETTGSVILYGGEAININERIYSNNGDISITAGAGGIVGSVATLSLPTGLDDPATTTTYRSDIDAKQGNVTLLATGNIKVPSVRTRGRLRITSTSGRILDSGVFNSDAESEGDDGSSYPHSVRLAGELGIDNFHATAGDVEAVSTAGSVTSSTFSAGNVFVQAADDISGTFSGTVELAAGRDVTVSNAYGNLLWVSAGRHFKVEGDLIARGLKAQAGGDIFLNPVNGPIYNQIWIEGPGGNMTLRSSGERAEVDSVQGLWLSAPSGQIDILRPVHVSNTLEPTGPTSTEVALQPTTLSAYGNVTVEHLETIGPVSIESLSGNITLKQPIGAHVSEEIPAVDKWNPNDQGVASLNLTATAPGAIIELQGARSVGPIVVRAYGGAVISTAELLSNSGSVDVLAGYSALSPFPTPPGQRLHVSYPSVPVGPLAPGPLRATPLDAPSIPGVPVPAAPALPEILISTPGAIDVGVLAAPATAGNTTSPLLTRALPVADTTAELNTEDRDNPPGEAESQHLGDTEDTQAGLLLFTGGRGLAQSVDLGRSGAFGSTPAYYASEEDEGQTSRRRRNISR